MGNTPRLPFDEPENPMTSVHQVTLIVDPHVSDDDAKAMLIDHIVSRLPDAQIDGPPTVSSDKLRDRKHVGITFTSKAYDMASQTVINMLIYQIETALTLDIDPHDEESPKVMEMLPGLLEMIRQMLIDMLPGGQG